MARRQWDPASLSALGGAFKGLREGLITGSALKTEDQQRKQRALEIQDLEREQEYRDALAALPEYSEGPQQQESDVRTQAAGNMFAPQPGAAEGTSLDSWSQDAGAAPPMPGYSQEAAKTGPEMDWTEWKNNRLAVAKMGGPEAYRLAQAEIAAIEGKQIQGKLGAATSLLYGSKAKEARQMAMEASKFDPTFKTLLDATWVSADGTQLMVEGKDGPVALNPDQIWGMYEMMQNPMEYKKALTEMEVDLGRLDADQATAQAAIRKADVEVAKLELEMRKLAAENLKEGKPALTTKEAMKAVDDFFNAFPEGSYDNTRLQVFFSKEDEMYGWLKGLFSEGDFKAAANIEGEVRTLVQDGLQAQAGSMSTYQMAQIATRLSAWARGREAEAPLSVVPIGVGEPGGLDVYKVRYPGTKEFVVDGDQWRSMGLDKVMEEYEQREQEGATPPPEPAPAPAPAPDTQREDQGIDVAPAKFTGATTSKALEKAAGLNITTRPRY